MYLNNQNIISKESTKALKDLQVLKKIVSGNIKIQDLDNETKSRLISLCNSRTKQINDMIKKQQILNNELKLELKQVRKNKNIKLGV